LPTLPSTIADELATNPFLRAGTPAVFAAAEARAGRRLADPIEAFAIMREWKNAFR
jgi:hydroxyacylglutathione hydrolase